MHWKQYLRVGPQSRNAVPWSTVHKSMKALLPVAALLLATIQVASAFDCTEIDTAQLYAECVASPECTLSVFHAGGVPSLDLFAGIAARAPNVLAPPGADCALWNASSVARALYVAHYAERANVCSADKFPVHRGGGRIECACPRDRVCLAGSRDRTDIVVIVFVITVVIGVLGCVFKT